MEPLTVCSWNCKGFRSRKQDLMILIKDRNPDVIMLQETHLPSNQHLLVSGYLTYRLDSPPGTWRGGLAILIKKSIPSIQVALTSSIHAIACTVGSTNPVTFCNLYVESYDDLSSTCLDQIFHHLSTPLVIAGDFNAHNVLWGSRFTDLRGSTVESFLDINNLFLINNDDATYLDARTGISDAIDLMICSLNLSRHTTFSVLPYLYGSDHYPLLLTLYTQGCRQPPCTRWLFKRADWQAFKRLLTLPPLSEHASCEENLRIITSTILSAAETCIPRRQVGCGRPQVPWWSRECRFALRDRRKALWRFKRNCTQENLMTYKEARTRCKKVFLKEKTRAWREYISTITSSTSVSEMWDKVRALAGKRASKGTPSLYQNGTSISDPERVAEIFAAHFATVSATESYHVTL